MPTNTPTSRPTIPVLPWQKPSEFPVNDPEAFDLLAYQCDVYELDLAAAVTDPDGVGRIGPLADVVRSLRHATLVAREQFETVVDAGGHQAVAAADLGQVLSAASALQRAAEALAISATAGFARREEHDDLEDRTRPVESIRARGFTDEWSPTSIGHLLRLSTRTASARVERSAGMASLLPQSLEAVLAGHVEAWQLAKVLDFFLEVGVDDETAREIDAYIAPRLATIDPTRIMSLVRHALGRIRPTLLPDRARKARENRALQKWEVEPGLTEITARMPSHQAAAIWAAATDLAKEYVQADPALSLDQARLDAFVDLALARVSVSTTVTLGVPVVTSAYARTGEAPVELRDPEAPPMGDPEGDPNSDSGGDSGGDAPRDTGGAAGSREPGEGGASASVPDWAAHPDSTGDGFRPPPGCTAAERAWWLSGVHLPGIGYVPPDVVQSLIGTFGTTISTALIDADRGLLLSYIHHAYRPSAAMRAMVQMRDGRCRAFGCSMPALRCDLDHATPFDRRGPTCGENLAGLCRRHHRAKQRREWSYTLDPDTGVAWWVNSRTGAMRTTLPDIAIGCLDPPLSAVGDEHRAADNTDDRPRVNGYP